MPFPKIPHDALVGLIAVITLPVGILSLFFLRWFFLVPVIAILGEEVDFDTETRMTEDPIDQLRRRYAEGEIDDAEFERRLDALLETEDLDSDDSAAIERAIERIGASDAPDESEIDVERE